MTYSNPSSIPTPQSAQIMWIWRNCTGISPATGTIVGHPRLNPNQELSGVGGGGNMDLRKNVTQKKNAGCKFSRSSPRMYPSAGESLENFPTSPRNSFHFALKLYKLLIKNLEKENCKNGKKIDKNLVSGKIGAKMRCFSKVKKFQQGKTQKKCKKTRKFFQNRKTQEMCLHPPPPAIKRRSLTL